MALSYRISSAVSEWLEVDGQTFGSLESLTGANSTAPSCLQGPFFRQQRHGRDP